MALFICVFEYTYIFDDHINPVRDDNIGLLKCFRTELKDKYTDELKV